MAKISYTPALKKEYEDLFASCTVRTERKALVDAACEKIIASKDRYKKISANAGKTPWFVIAVIHYRECNLSFAKHLHNGDPLTARTTHVPAHRPVSLPASGSFPYTFEESAQDALTVDKFTTQSDWSLGHTLYLLEAYNGFGYRLHHPNVLSPYLWSFTNHYSSGGYPADNTWSDTYVNKQCGTVTLIRRVVEMGHIVIGAEGKFLNELWAKYAAVQYDPANVVELARQLQHDLNRFTGTTLTEDGEAGKLTSDAYKKLMGRNLPVDPRGA